MGIPDNAPSSAPSIEEVAKRFEEAMNVPLRDNAARHTKPNHNAPSSTPRSALMPEKRTMKL